MCCDDAAGTIQNVQADYGFSSGTDSGAVDAICANLNPIAIPTLTITSGNINAAPGSPEAIQIKLLNDGKRRIDSARVVLKPDEDPTNVVATLFQRDAVNIPSTAQRPADGIQKVLNITLPSSLPAGGYWLDAQLMTRNSYRIRYTVARIHVTLQ